MKYKAAYLLLLFFTFFSPKISAQSISDKLQSAIKSLATDSQLKHGLVSFYVIDADSGNKVFAFNEEIGLAPASCQKIITAASGYELLDKNHPFITKIELTALNDLIITGDGDPTFGSWRWPETKPEVILTKIVAAVKLKGLRSIGKIWINDIATGYQPIPDGWIWQDIGNYYGAGSYGLNWRENQYDLFLNTKEPGSNAVINKTNPDYIKPMILNLIKAGEKGSGDNGYIYSAPYQDRIFATGKVPPFSNGFSISGSMPDPGKFFGMELKTALQKEGISCKEVVTFSEATRKNLLRPKDASTLISIASAPLQDIESWFLKKSINLYGEAIVKKIALLKNAADDFTDNGTKEIVSLWKSKGIDVSAMNIIDGSGLSPANRVTTKLLVDILSFVQKQPYANDFFDALPQSNGIRMKDGYINAVRSYSGYINGKSNRYIFSIITNNFTGSAAEMRVKMWKVLDLLKN